MARMRQDKVAERVAIGDDADVDLMPKLAAWRRAVLLHEKIRELLASLPRRRHWPNARRSSKGTSSRNSRVQSDPAWDRSESTAPSPDISPPSQDTARSSWHDEGAPLARAVHYGLGRSVA